MHRLPARAASPDVPQVLCARGRGIRPARPFRLLARKRLARRIDMRTQGKPGLWLGLLSGLFLTLPLVAIFYMAYRLGALPFPPFNLFDWQTRILPGSVLAKGINTMVRVIGWTHATDTSRVAKLAEQSMAVSEFILAGMAISALFFMFLRLGGWKAVLLVGSILGVALGLAIAWASNLIESSPA